VSTKIHNGYMLPMLSLQKLTARLIDFHGRAQQKANDLFALRVVADAVEQIDREQLGLEPSWYFINSRLERRHIWGPQTSVVFEAEQFVRARHRSVYASGKRDPRYDFGCQVCVIPAKDRVLAMLYTEQEVLEAEWEATPGVTPFPYWDNTDPPGGMSDEAWEARGRIWDAAIPSGVPAKHGFSVTPIDGGTYLQADRETLERYLAAMLPAKRVAMLAHDNVLDARINAIKPLAADEPAAVDTFYRALDWIRTPEGKAAVAAKTVAMAAQIKPTLTIEDLRRPVFTGRRPKETA
jgi:hypothetical protein